MSYLTSEKDVEDLLVAEVFDKVAWDPNFDSPAHPNGTLAEVTSAPGSTPSTEQQILTNVKTQMASMEQNPAQEEKVPVVHASAAEQYARIAIAMKALSDKPLSSIPEDQNDPLGFRIYSEALTDFITNDKTEKPLRIAIDAPWGMGKTTLMEMIQSELKRRADKQHQPVPLIVNFNAWKYDQENSLWAAFVLKILQDVRQQISWQRRLGLWWRLNWNRMDWDQFRRGLTRTAFTIISLVFVGILLNLWTFLRHGDSLLLAFQQIYTTFASGVSALVLFYNTAKAKHSSNTNPFSLKLTQFIQEPNYKERIGFIAQFEKDFEAVMKAVTEDGKRLLVVFIDDLDRCEPPKPVEVVGAMNLLMDSEYCVFVLGMDTRSVAASIEAKYKDLQEPLSALPAFDGLTFGLRFLEKLLQITFRIPQVDIKGISSFIDERFYEQESAPSHPLLPQVQNAESSLAASLNKTEKSSRESAETSSRTESTSTSVNTIIQAQKERQEQFAQTLNESPEVKLAVREAARFLESNPRKIKRFINLFRLQAFIANRRDLFYTQQINLGLLAKWLVLVTRWPSIFDALLMDPTFIQRLKEAYTVKERLQVFLQQRDLSAIDKQQALLKGLLEDTQLKKLILSSDLSMLVKTFTDHEMAELPRYLSLAESIVLPTVVSSAQNTVAGTVEGRQEGIIA